MSLESSSGLVVVELPGYAVELFLGEAPYICSFE